MSGQVGLDESGAALADPEQRYLAVFEQTAEILALAGSGFEDAVEIVSFHSSFADFEIAVGAEIAVPGALVELK